MSRQRYKLRWWFIALVAFTVIGLFWAGVQRLTFETDLTASLPQNDPVMADARRIMASHPIQDRVVIDVGINRAERETLVQAAALIERRLKESGLFKRVGLGEEQQAFPELAASIAGRLPVLLTARDLEEKVAPLLAPEKIREGIATHFAQLGQLDSIGQSALIAQDPLNLRNLILSRLSHLAPTRNARFYQGQLLSADEKHLLIIAEPRLSGMDTRFAREATALMERIGTELNRNRPAEGKIVLTPVGAYRAALDNETSSKQGTERAVIFSTIAIVLMLLIAFPRPFIGLLALLPSLAGTALALFVYSLFQPAITMMAIGFGSAIISFTVDYGIAYLLFLDRMHATRGLEATREVWSLGLLAMLTTAVSFAFLAFSGFAALAQIGVFAALGVLFTYLFVHLIYPIAFPILPPAKSASFLPVQKLADRIAATRGPIKAWAAVALAISLLIFAKPVFRVDLNAMNALSPETLAAEKLLGNTWGNLQGRIHAMVEGRNLRQLQQEEDCLATLLERQTESGTLAAGFSPSFIFPGEMRAARNLQAWQAFWNPERIALLRANLKQASREMGFAPDAFAPFMKLVETTDMAAVAMPESLFNLMGVSQSRDRTHWVQVSTLTPGAAYDGEAFYRQFKSACGGVLFDPALFTRHLGEILMNGFIKMALMVGVVTLAVAFFYLLDGTLTLLALLPTLFALVCTLGTLNLLEQPLGIPTLMVGVVVIGMGTDYALYLVRAHQRYLTDDHPSLGLIRLSVLLSFATTFMGFGVLALSGHALLKSAGIALTLGIGYSFLGAVTITPPLLKRVFSPPRWPQGPVLPGTPQHRRRTLRRYRHLEAHPRFFARFKIMLDPMFDRLAVLLPAPRRIIDIGCGYGVPAAWLLALHPEVRVFGIDPDRKRVAIAARAMGERGVMEVGRAPDLPASAPGRADAALMLDMIHMITDDELRLCFGRLHDRLETGGRLILRATVPSRTPTPWLRRIEEWRLKTAGLAPHYRSTEAVAACLAEAGFTVKTVEPDANGREEFWFVAEKPQINIS